MQGLLTAALAILFLLIPHQEPLADSSPEAAKPADASDRALAATVADSEGYVWSLGASRAAVPAPPPVADHLQTDGYSWSARSQPTALDSVR